jgi:hypothetical protein
VYVLTGAPASHDVAVAGITALGAGLARHNVGTVEDGVAQRPQPSERCFLDDRLG